MVQESGGSSTAENLQNVGPQTMSGADQLCQLQENICLQYMLEKVSEANFHVFGQVQ